MTSFVTQTHIYKTTTKLSELSLTLQRQSITISLIPLKPQHLIQPVGCHPCGIGSQLYMMHIQLLCCLNHSRHQLLSVSTATALRVDNHRFNISNGKLQRMFDAKRSGSHNVPFIPNHIHVNISIIQGIVQKRLITETCGR